MNDIGDQIERGSDGPEFSNVQPVPPTVIEENKELRIWCNWASKEIIIGDELNKKLHQQLINASTEQSRLHGIIQNIKANNNTLRRRRKEKHEKLSAAQAELANVKQCADDAVLDANICRKLADRQTRLLDKAQAVVDKLPKTRDGAPMVPGGHYWARCRDHYAEYDALYELLEVIWWKGGGDDCFNPEYVLAKDDRPWEFFTVEGVYSSEAAYRANKEKNDE